VQIGPQSLCQPLRPFIGRPLPVCRIFVFVRITQDSPLAVASLLSLCL